MHLDRPNDKKFQRREWIFERVGWLFISAVLIAAMLGLLGPGLLSSRTATTADGSLTLHYDRYVQQSVPLAFKMRFLGASQIDERVKLIISQDFLDRVSIASIVPTPEAVLSVSDGQAFVFRRTPSSDWSVLFRFEFESPGTSACRIELEGKEGIAISQFVFP
jgi:hypothetical protein